MESWFVNFSNTVGWYVNVINSIFKSCSHFVSVLVEWLLDYFLVSVGDATQNALRVCFLHEFIKVLLSDAKRFNMFNGLVQELGYFVLDAGAIIYWAYYLLGWGHNNSDSIENFIKQSIPNSHGPVSNKCDFKYFFALVLDKISMLITIKKPRF